MTPKFEAGSAHCWRCGERCADWLRCRWGLFCAACLADAVAYQIDKDATLALDRIDAEEAA